MLPNWLTWLDHTVAELVLALEEYTSEQNFELKYDEGTAFQPKTNCDQMLVNEKEIARREVNVSLSKNPFAVKCYSKIAFPGHQINRSLASILLACNQHARIQTAYPSSPPFNLAKD